MQQHLRRVYQSVSLTVGSELDFAVREIADSVIGMNQRHGSEAQHNSTARNGITYGGRVFVKLVHGNAMVLVAPAGVEHEVKWACRAPARIATRGW